MSLERLAHSVKEIWNDDFVQNYSDGLVTRFKVWEANGQIMVHNGCVLMQADRIDGNYEMRMAELPKDLTDTRGVVNWIDAEVRALLDSAMEMRPPAPYEDDEEEDYYADEEEDEDPFEDHDLPF